MIPICHFAYTADVAEVRALIKAELANTGEEAAHAHSQQPRQRSLWADLAHSKQNTPQLHAQNEQRKKYQKKTNKQTNNNNNF